MVNFDYWTPTRLVFGRDVVREKLVEAMKPLGKRVLLTYGGGSIKKMGLYDLVKDLLKDFEIVELGGIEPNPKYAPSVLEGVRLCREHTIDVILAVGGGSVLDCSKAIAAGACYDGEPWDLISYKAKAQKALPIVDIITLAATGSEYDCGGVITNTAVNDKRGYMDELLYPVVSFMDPTYTFSVPAKHTAAGTADAINHMLEQYFCAHPNDISDGFLETLIKTLMKWVPVAMKEPENYEARAELMYACTFGCNGILSMGTGGSGWPMHAIEHALSAYYDITHGVGLAIITPRWMKHILSDEKNILERFVKYGRNVYGINEGTDREIAEQVIDRTYRFFESIGIPMHLREVGIDEAKVAEMAHHVASIDHLENCPFVPLTEQDIAEIITASL